MSSFSSLPPSEFLKNISPEMAEQLEAIIASLKYAGILDIEDLLTRLFDRFITDLPEELQGMIDISGFTPTQLSALRAAMAALAKELAEKGIFAGSQEQAIEILLHGLFKAISSISQKKEREMEFAFLHEEERKKLKLHLEQMLHYESYKIITPHQVAGETEQQNVINNIRVGGVSYAEKHEGGNNIEKHTNGKFPPKADKSFVEALKKEAEALKGKGGMGSGF